VQLAVGRYACNREGETRNSYKVSIRKTLVEQLLGRWIQGRMLIIDGIDCGSENRTDLVQNVAIVSAAVCQHPNPRDRSIDRSVRWFLVYT
jgi:hypothetical protein